MASTIPFASKFESQHEAFKILNINVPGYHFDFFLRLSRVSESPFYFLLPKPAKLHFLRRTHHHPQGRASAPAPAHTLTQSDLSNTPPSGSPITFAPPPPKTPGTIHKKHPSSAVRVSGSGIANNSISGSSVSTSTSSSSPIFADIDTSSPSPDGDDYPPQTSYESDSLQRRESLLSTNHSQSHSLPVPAAPTLPNITLVPVLHPNPKPRTRTPAIEPVIALEAISGLYFEDGNIILKSRNKVFKVYRGLLIGVSETLKGVVMSGLGGGRSGNGVPTGNVNGNIDGCPVIVMDDDDPVDLEVFLRALIDIQFFEPVPYRTTSRILLGILRLSSKYDAVHLRKRALRHLSTAFPTSLSSLQLHESESWTFDMTFDDRIVFTSLCANLGIEWAIPVGLHKICCALGWEGLWDACSGGEGKIKLELQDKYKKGCLKSLVGYSNMCFEVTRFLVFDEKSGVNRFPPGLGGVGTGGELDGEEEVTSEDLTRVDEGSHNHINENTSYWDPTPPQPAPPPPSTKRTGTGRRGDDDTDHGHLQLECINVDPKQCMQTRYTWLSTVQKIISSPSTPVSPPSSPMGSSSSNASSSIFQSMHHLNYSFPTPTPLINPTIPISTSINATTLPTPPLISPFYIWGEHFWSLYSLSLCPNCLKKDKLIHEKSINEIWDGLPGWFGLDDWATLRELKKRDLGVGWEMDMEM